MPTNVATEPQMVDAAEQIRNAEVVRKYIEGHDRGPGDLERYFAPKARIWIDSRPSTCPVVFEDDVVHIGPQAMRDINAQFSDRGFTYEITIHDIFTCGPLVIVNRTDTRQEAGKDDIPIPAIGVFAVRDGKIIEWADYFR
jgi:limonene-1,2-epoxide hydrolase